VALVVARAIKLAGVFYGNFFARRHRDELAGIG
jgi:hypothetical protein